MHGLQVPPAGASDARVLLSISTTVLSLIWPISMSVPRPLPLVSSRVLDSMDVGSEIILSDEDDDAPFCIDCFEEAERERSFFESENRERMPMTKGPRLPAFFKSGA